MLSAVKSAYSPGQTQLFTALSIILIIIVLNQQKSEAKADEFVDFQNISNLFEFQLSDTILKYYSTAHNKSKIKMKM